MATDQERAVFNEKMTQWQAHLDRYQATRDPQLILDPNVIAEVSELRYAAPGSTGWENAEHLCAWYHWLRYEALGDGPGEADRQAAEQLFRSRYSLRPDDLPESLRRKLDAIFQQLFASVMAQVSEQTGRRRPDRRQLKGLLSELETICNFTARSDPQYFDRLEARAHQGYSGEDVRLVKHSRLAARLRERRPASRKDWVTILSPAETGRACIIPPDSPKTRSSTCAHCYM